MELKPEETDLLTDYLDHYGSLIGDKRTKKAFQGTIKGIIAAETLVCARIAAHSPELAAGKNSEQRIRRMVGIGKQKTTKRSSLDAGHLCAKLQERALEQLQDEEEVWVMDDGCDLRKPYARRMEGLMRVKKLDGEGLTNGYRTLNAIGIGKKRRGILYQRLFSSQEADFVSEPYEVQRMLHSVIKATQSLKAKIIHAMDSGFDDVAVWSTIWEAGQQLVCRLCHLERLVERQTSDGHWETVSLTQAASGLQELAEVATDMVVQKGRQTVAKLQAVKARISACPLRLTYQVAARTRQAGERRQKLVWLVQVVLEGLNWEPWWLLTDIPVVDVVSATKVFCIYRQRWAAEDVFKVSKECLGWEEVQLLNLDAVRNLVALAWVATGFLYELGVTLEWYEVRLLARLGGWEERKDPARRPGKIVLMRGLRRLLDMQATQAILRDEIATSGQLPPRLAALIGYSTTT